MENEQEHNEQMQDSQESEKLPINKKIVEKAKNKSKKHKRKIVF